MRQYEKEQAKIAQLEKSAEQLRMFAFKGMDKTYRRALSMEKRIERMRTTDKPTKERALSAQFKSQEFYGDEVFALKKLKKSFGDRVLFHDVDLQVRGGERIALIGDNGTGKSTLIKMLMEEEYPDEGKIKFGPSVRIAYLPQIVEFDVPERNLVDTMLYSKRSITPQSARNRLAAFHFTGEDVFKSVIVLSGGELSRLKLCILMDEEVNLLILDEPTNHLDIASREWIEEAVESYDGTLLFVSHDRYFINRFATRVWELENGVITDYPMGFARYRQVKALEAQNKIDHTPKAVKEKTVTEKPKPNRSAQQARRQLTICEKEISTQETAIAEIEQRLEEAGAATVMPLAAPIGTNKGLVTRDLLAIIIEQSNVPVIVDAGLGAPSHAAAAMEMGADAVLVNTAIAVAGDPVRMARAFAQAVVAGREAYEAGLGAQAQCAEASSPLTAFLD